MNTYINATSGSSRHVSSAIMLEGVKTVKLHEVLTFDLKMPQNWRILNTMEESITFH